MHSSSTQAERPFEIVAKVLLSDHLHTSWKLPDGDDDYSTRWRLTKSRFTRSLLAAGYDEPPRCTSRKQRAEHAVWQRRSWEHTIRDEKDWKQHLDYIHYNPVKHGYVRRPWDWENSTSRRYVEMGHYDQHWGETEPLQLVGADFE